MKLALAKLRTLTVPDFFQPAAQLSIVVVQKTSRDATISIDKWVDDEKEDIDEGQKLGTLPLGRFSLSEAMGKMIGCFEEGEGLWRRDSQAMCNSFRTGG